MNADCVRIRSHLDVMDKGGHHVSPRYRKALDFALEQETIVSQATIKPADRAALEKAIDLLGPAINQVKEALVAPDAAKAFPPKKDDKEKKDDRTKPEGGGGGGGQQTLPPPDAAAGDNSSNRPADGPDLAAVIAGLTTAIVQLQEMVRPKEAAPAPAPVAAPANEPDGDEEVPPNTAQEDAPPPGSQDRQPDTQGKPPVDDPRRRKEEEEEGREAMDRYRRAGFPGVVKGYLKKEHHASLKEAADHLDELSGMEVGAKWMGSHRTACKAHCAAVRKALEESSSTAGGATAVAEEEEPPAMTDREAKEVAAEAVDKAFGPLREQIFRLTGKRA